jgi:hypothetical protein
LADFYLIIFKYVDTPKNFIISPINHIFTIVSKGYAKVL